MGPYLPCSTFSLKNPPFGIAIAAGLVQSPCWVSDIAASFPFYGLALILTKAHGVLHRFPCRASANTRPPPRLIAHYRLYMRLAAGSARVQPARFPRASSRLARASAADNATRVRSPARLTQPAVR